MVIRRRLYLAPFLQLVEKKRQVCKWACAIIMTIICLLLVLNMVLSLCMNGKNMTSTFYYFEIGNFHKKTTVLNLLMSLLQSSLGFQKL